MQSRPEQINKTLTAMVEAMNRRPDNLDPGIDRRAEPRRATCARCDLWVFDRLGQKRKIADVVTRNLSFCGISVLLKRSGPLRVGQPIEAVVASSHGLGNHAAGTIAFCRHMDDGYVEVGITVKAVGSHWILAGDAKDSAARYDWFAKALRNLKTQASAPKT